MLIEARDVRQAVVFFSSHNNHKRLTSTISDVYLQVKVQDLQSCMWVNPEECNFLLD